MTDNQFRQLLAAQLAQIALLQAIEANVSFMTHKHVPSEKIHPDWKKARALLKLAMKEVARSAD